MGNVTGSSSLDRLRLELDLLLHARRPALQADEDRLKEAMRDYERSLRREDLLKAA